MAEMKVNLSQKSIKEAIQKLKSFKENSKSLEEKILNDIAEEGLDEINSSLSNSDFEFSERVNAFSRVENGKAEIGIQGNQAIYEDSSLNPYNSGKTIRENKRIDSNASSEGIPVGGLYWTYKYNGEKIYTQGRPAGAHVYKASQRIKKNAKKIIIKRLGEELSKL